MTPPAAETPAVHRFVTHRRTVTETDIVTFVNVVGLHEPFFIDMEYITRGKRGRATRPNAAAASWTCATR